MPKNFTNFAFFTVCLLRVICYPFLKLIGLFNKIVANRIEFEARNKYHSGSRSFRKDKLKARMAFEVSSEGELEQVRPIIDELLKQNESIEIIYASPSVEKKVYQIFHTNPKQVRILRLPLLSFFFSFSFIGGPQILSWVTAPVLVLCRYDFYPELFLLKFLNDTKLVLISATLKNRQEILKRPGSFLYEYWSQIYQQFDYIVTATAQDKDRLVKLGIDFEKMDSFDFRFIQIKNRLIKGLEKLQVLGPFEAFLNSYNDHSKLLLAQCWPHEMSGLNRHGCEPTLGP